MRAFKRICAVAVILSLAAGAFYVLWLSPRHVTPVLMYHRFGYESGSLYVTPENFEKQMAYLQDRGFEVIPAVEYVRGLKEGRRFGRKTVVITVDDGNRDNFTHAYPVLERRGLPATIFLVSNFIGHDPDYMDWDQVRRMHEAGIDFGGHTMNDVYLPEVRSADELWREITGSKAAIEEALGEPAPLFAYTTGGFTESVKETVRRAGYEGAFTTNRGFSRGNDDPFELKRVKVTNSDAVYPFHFWAKLSGYYDLFRSKKRGH